MILKENHDEANIRHLEQHRIMELIKRTYWWPGLKENIKNYVQECFKYQQNKVQHQKSRRIISIEYTSRTMARNQHRHYWTSTEIKWNRCYSSYCGPIHKDNSFEGNYNEYLIQRNSKDLLR